MLLDQDNEGCNNLSLGTRLEHDQPEPQRIRSGAYVADTRPSIGIARIDHETYHRSLRHQLVQKLKLFGRQDPRPQGCPGDVRTTAVHATDTPTRPPIP